MGNIFFYSSSNKNLAILYFSLFCFIYIWSKYKINTRQKGKYRKYLENKSLLAADFHDLITKSWELIHEIIGSTLIKTWTSTWVLILLCIMLNEWCIVFLILSKYFFKDQAFFFLSTDLWVHPSQESTVCMHCTLLSPSLLSASVLPS